MQCGVQETKLSDGDILPEGGVAFFNDIVESAQNGVVLVDREGKILVMNQAARRIVKKRTNEIQGCKIQHVIPTIWENIREIFETGNGRIGRRITIGKNEIIANCTPVIKDQEVAGILNLFQDISEYEKVLTQLEPYNNLNDELQAIIDSSYDGLWVCDHEARVLRVNHTSERMSGVKEADVKGRKMSDLVDEGLFDKSATLEVLKNRTAVTLIQKLEDGSRILVTGNPVLDQEGNIRLVVVNARDITELNRLHAELEQSRALNDQYSAELKYALCHRDLSSKVIIRSPVMQQVFERVIRVAQVESSVLITGESGTGKGLFAELIHKGSGRAKGPLIHVNCGAIPESLIEAELFGYEKGAFTGAQAEGKLGYFEMAAGGTLLLDEVGEIPLNAQVKLLRFLEDNEVMRVGSIRPRKIDVRVIAATNRDLEDMVAKGLFRKDLFFRLKVIPIKIPPLRQRSEDVPPLIHHFLKLYNEKCGTRKALSPTVIDTLRHYAFPGNVRELANIIEQLVVLSSGDLIGLEDLPSDIRQQELAFDHLFPQNEWNLNRVLKSIEGQMIQRALKNTGSQRQAAKLLGIDHSTLSRKLKRLRSVFGVIVHHVA